MKILGLEKPKIRWKDNPKEYMRQYKQSDKYKQKVKDYREKAKDKMKVLQKNWYKSNKEKVRLQKLNWKRENPIKAKELDNRYPYKNAARSRAHWYKLRDSICKLCNSTKNLHFHHTNYEKDEGFTLCAQCHSLIHCQIRKEMSI